MHDAAPHSFGRRLHYAALDTALLSKRAARCGWGLDTVQQRRTLTLLTIQHSVSLYLGEWGEGMSGSTCRHTACMHARRAHMHACVHTQIGILAPSSACHPHMRPINSTKNGVLFLSHPPKAAAKWAQHGAP